MTADRSKPSVEGAGKNRQEPLAVLEAVARAPAQRSLCGARAKREGVRSRAAYKLMEIDDKHRLLCAWARAWSDLGAAPGGWSQVAAKRVGAAEGKGRVSPPSICSPSSRSPGVEFIQLDFSTCRRPSASKALLGGEADLVLSDMAAKRHRPSSQPTTSGSWRSPRRPPNSPATCSSQVARFSARFCKAARRRRCSPQLKRDFSSVKHVKPAASRADSAELYLLAMGFRGRS